MSLLDRIPSKLLVTILLGLAIFLSVFLTIMLFLFGSNLQFKLGDWVFALDRNSIPVPTPTPSSPSRIVENTVNFPWQERWRLVRHSDSFYQNVRNLVAIKEGIVFTDLSNLKFVNAYDGDAHWAVELDGWIDSIAVDENRVYVAGQIGPFVEAYDLQTGEFIWQSVRLPGKALYYLRPQDRGLYAYETENLVYVFDKGTGQPFYKFRVPTRYALLEMENKDILQSDGEQLMLVRKGENVWQTKLSGPPQKFPQIHNNMLIIRFENDRTVFDGVAGLNLETGKVIWQRAGEFLSNFVITNDLLYVISKEAKILILDPQTGKTVGSTQILPDNINTFRPIAAVTATENMLYVYFEDSQELIAFESTRE